MPSRVDWFQDAYMARADEIMEISIIAIGEEAAAEMKVNAHRLTGLMSRTIHVERQPRMGHRITIYVGAHTEYSIYEYNRGGSHDFVSPGVQRAQSVTPYKVAAAIRSIVI